ncbi:hypothetical protein AgCh_002755 [Apium graveolens]
MEEFDLGFIFFLCSLLLVLLSICVCFFAFDEKRSTTVTGHISITGPIAATHGREARVSKAVMSRATDGHVSAAAVTGPIPATSGTVAAKVSTDAKPRATDGHVSATAVAGPITATSGSVAAKVSTDVKPRATDGPVSATGPVAATRGAVPASQGCFWWQCSCAGCNGGGGRGCSGGVGGC